MANKRNYQKELDAKIAGLHGEVPTLLLHSCCAPCSSYVLEYLSQYFSITLFYYNPNIYPPTEYEHRVEEQQRLIRSLPAVHPISFCPGPYDSDRFYKLTRGMENVPEGGERCFVCYEMRLREAAEMAKQLKLDYFTTTLSISPLKNAEKLNEIGERIAAEYGIPYLNSDFKKRVFSAQRVPQKGRLQAQSAIKCRVRPLPPGLLRLRLFPPGTRRTGGSTGKWQQLMCSLKCPAKSSVRICCTN